MKLHAAVLVLAAATVQAEEAATWHHDVQPIVQRRCLACHVPGGIAPFPLTTYDEAAAQRTKIVDAVTTAFMPPWKPKDGCRDYQDSRRLSKSEVDTIVAWANAGAPAGEAPAVAPQLPPPATLPWTDVVLDAGFDYTPSTAREDDYRCFLLDPKLTEARDLIGYDVQPGVRAQVHHVLLFGIPAADARAADLADPGPGWSCFGGPNTGSTMSSATGVLGGWVPGSVLAQYPADTGIAVAANRVIVMQIHYNTHHSGIEPTPDRTKVALQFAKQRVAKPGYVVPIADLGFAVPPDAVEHTTSVSFPLPLTATIWGVAPHMHTLGRKVRVDVGDACAIDIPSWDFHWQQMYTFTQPMTVAPGTPLKLSCTWDNPTTRTIRWGEGTDDEMCLNYFYMTF